MFRLRGATTVGLGLLVACAPRGVTTHDGSHRAENAPALTSNGSSTGHAIDPAPFANAFPAAPSPLGPFTLPAGPRDDDPLAPLPARLALAAWTGASRAKNVPAPPPICATFAARVAVPGAVDVASALSSADPARRDALLLGLAEVYPDDKRLWLRALRADLAPVECADTIVDPFLVRFTMVDTPVSSVLVGVSLASKLARKVMVPPSMWGVRDKEKVRAFIAGPLKAWFVDEAMALDTLASGTADLTSYGRGIAQMELGLAELRLAGRLRAALKPTMPATWDADVKAQYASGLEISAEVRKFHGRDAVLGGLADFAQVGVLEDPRVAHARTTLARLFPDRRIDALDGLMLPPRSTPAPSTPVEVASRSASTYWLGFVGADPHSLDVLVRGVPQPTRARHRIANNLHEVALHEAYARSRFEMGRTYWRRVDFVEAAYAAYAGQSQDARLVLALALALVHAPDGAAAMMMTPSSSAFGLTHTESLDAVASENGPWAGMAAFDAAYLRSLSPPDGKAAAPHLRDVAARFRAAEPLLATAAQKKRAADQAIEMDRLAAQAE